MNEIKYIPVADNTVIGLPYLLICTKNVKVNAFLRESLWLCGLLSEQIQLNTTMSSSKIEISNATQQHNIKHRQQVVEIKKKTTQVDEHLRKCFACEESLTESDVKQIQNFFDALSSIYARKAMSNLFLKKEWYK